MLLPTNLHDFSLQFTCYRRPILRKNRIIPAKTHHLLNVSLVQKMRKSLIINLLSKPLKISPIPGTWTRWLKKRPAFVLKSCGHEKFFQEECSVWPENNKVSLFKKKSCVQTTAGRLLVKTEHRVVSRRLDIRMS